MPALRATREVRYAGRTYMPGMEFEATEKDAKLLVAIKKAAPADGPIAKSVVDLPAAAMQPSSEPTDQEVPATDPLPSDRRYQRRDMTAEDGQTGTETSSPSSRRGRPQRGRKSSDSEE